MSVSIYRHISELIAAFLFLALGAVAMPVPTHSSFQNVHYWHSTAGCIAGQVSGSSCADGAAAGALSAILAPSVGGAGWDQDKQIAAQNMFATGALLLAGSDANSASTGGQIAGSAHENNYLRHVQLDGNPPIFNGVRL